MFKRGAELPAVPGQVWRDKRVRTPSVLQMEATECGAAALGIVLGTFGRFVPLEKLREECGVSRDGSKAVNVLKVARRYGMIASGHKLEPATLRTVPLPLILFWNFNHFLVLEGIKKDRVFLNDPAMGPRTVSIEELDEAFTGVALCIQPGPEFKKEGSPPSLAAALKERLKAIRPALACAVTAGLALVLPGLIIPAFSKIFVDDILVSRKMEWLKPLLLAMTLTVVVRGYLTWLQQSVLLRQQVKLGITMSAQFFQHLLRLPYSFFSQRFSGELASRVQLNDRIALLMSGELASTALSLLTIVFFAALMACYDPLLTSISVGAAVLNFAALRYTSRKRVDLNQRLLQERGKLMGTAMGGLSLMETLKATGSEASFFSRWAGYQAKAANAQQELSWWTNLLTPVPAMLTMLNTAAVLGVGGFRVMDGHMTMGSLVAFQILTVAFLTPVEQMVKLGASFQEAVGSMRRVDDVMGYEQDRVYAPGRSQVPLSKESGTHLAGLIEMRNITFGYSKLEPPLIEGFSLCIQPGARVALVGGSGCGKSTLSRLACGLLEPWEGDVLLDGRKRREIAREVLVNSLSYVDQDSFLFDGTVRDNLTMWSSAVPESDLVRAAKDALIHDDISARAGGYDAMVVEGGRNFSGGQRQRLEIARALVSHPSILILDEATSALDAHTEELIDRNLRRRGASCLIIAHRLSTIRDCDEIIVLDRGRVVERGTHEELMEVAGHYRWLVES